MNNYSNYNSYNQNPYILSSNFKQQTNSWSNNTNRYSAANLNTNTNINNQYNMYNGNISIRVDNTGGYNSSMNRNNVNTGNNQPLWPNFYLKFFLSKLVINETAALDIIFP